MQNVIDKSKYVTYNCNRNTWEGVIRMSEKGVVEVNIGELKQLSPYNIPGPKGWKYADEIEWFIRKKGEKWNVNEEEMLIGVNSIPPTDPNCLVYFAIGNGGYEEFFRKDLKPGGRWVSKSYMHRVVSRDKRGTFDYVKHIAYI